MRQTFGVVWEEKIIAGHLRASLEAEEKAVELLNALEGSISYVKDRGGPIMELRRSVLQEGRAVTDGVLDKVSPFLRKHWRDDYEQGLQEFVDSYQTLDFAAQYLSQIMLEEFKAWFNGQRQRFNLPEDF